MDLYLNRLFTPKQHRNLPQICSISRRNDPRVVLAFSSRITLLAPKSHIASDPSAGIAMSQISLVGLMVKTAESI